MQAQYSQDPNKSNAHIRALPGENAYFLIRAPPQIRALPWEIQSLLVNFLHRQFEVKNKGQNSISSQTMHN